MEGLKRRLGLLAGITLATGAALTMMGTTPHAKRTEAWLEKNTPMEVGDFTAARGPHGELYSYKMDQDTYQVLAPFGIVARLFYDGKDTYDVVVIMSDSKSSFHDPRQCFTAQGWDLSDLRTETVATKTRGLVPLTFVKIKGPRGDGVAAFAYKGPDHFFATNRDLYSSMFWTNLLQNRKSDCVFYRFIPQDPSADPVKFRKFIADYFDAANRTSKGLL